MHTLTRYWTQKISRHRKVAETETRICGLEQRRGFGNFYNRDSVLPPKKLYPKQLYPKQTAVSETSAWVQQL